MRWGAKVFWSLLDRSTSHAACFIRGAALPSLVAFTLTVQIGTAFANAPVPPPGPGWLGKYTHYFNELNALLKKPCLTLADLKAAGDIWVAAEKEFKRDLKDISDQEDAIIAQITKIDELEKQLKEAQQHSTHTVGNIPELEQQKARLENKLNPLKNEESALSDAKSELSDLQDAVIKKPICQEDGSPSPVTPAPPVRDPSLRCGTATHVSACAACKSEADAVNFKADEYSLAFGTRNKCDQIKAKMTDLAKELKACVAKKCGEAPKEQKTQHSRRNSGELEFGRNTGGVPSVPAQGWTGGYIGGELARNWGRVRSTETSALTGDVTNQFSDSGDPFGGGIVIGYDFSPRSSWVVGPFASLDWLRLTINHTFPGGTYLGTTTSRIVNVGAKAGYMVMPDWQVYGLAGAAWLSESLNLNFPAGFSTKNATTPGFTAGLGTEYHPGAWQVAGHPIALFLQYQHTWYDTANFNTPMPASPFFNYAFKRDDDMLKFGVIVHQ